MRVPRSLRARVALAAVAAIGLIAASGCGQLKRIPLPIGTTIDCLAVSDELEGLIEKGTDTPAAREVAYEKVRQSPCEGAGQSFGRAAVTGRIVQQKALLAANLVRDVETYARRSRDLEPTFRDYASTRMLGTLYVLAPAALLKHGDSETGLELLETLVHDHPDVPENRLRLAEAFVSLGDTESARPQICRCLNVRDRFRRDDQQLLNQLFSQLTAGGKSLGCDAPK